MTIDQPRFTANQCSSCGDIAVVGYHIATDKQVYACSRHKTSYREEAEKYKIRQARSKSRRTISVYFSQALVKAAHAQLVADGPPEPAHGTATCDHCSNIATVTEFKETT